MRSTSTCTTNRCGGMERAPQSIYCEPSTSSRLMEMASVLSIMRSRLSPQDRWIIPPQTVG
eukprot:21782-Prorocentrum_lima.AAC.1